MIAIIAVLIALLLPAVQQARAEAKFAKAAQAACGANAGWQLVDGTTVQCSTKRGHKTIVAQVTP